MKRIFLGICVLTLSLLPVLWFSEGCQGNLPAQPTVVPTPLANNVISNFNRGSLLMNPDLLNGAGGYFLSETYGGAAGQPNLIDGNNNPNILFPNPGDGSSYAVHIYGPQTDTYPSGFPAMEVFAFFSNNPDHPYYDLTKTTFKGIRFDLKILPNSTAGGVTVGDNNTVRRFGIASAPMVPPITAAGGTCPPNFSNNCYNYFWSPGNLPPTSPAVNDGWQPVSFLFSSLRTDSYPPYSNMFMNGSTTSGTAVGTNQYKTQVLFLLWKFDNNGLNSYTDYWIDNVQFY